MTIPPWLKIVLKLEGRHSDVFRDLVTLAACVCSSGQREDEYRRTAAKFTPEELNGLCEAFGDLMCLKLADPFLDLFGATYMERLSKHARQHLGEVYTPSSVALLMTKLVMHPPEPGETLKVAEPAVGSGTLILAAAQALEDLGVSRLHMQVMDTDLNPFAVDMALVNLGLAGVTAVVRHGNSLTGQVFREYPTPAWHFACPYSGETNTERLRGIDVLEMLRLTVPLPVRAAG
ncbi:N-6 DNA methylase [Deinococcus aestuarii]|uniref:N-6 DNA methylase n=1 Tax=Deinococcus aestuarii TaxID=2774531 RepID=UPI001C0BF22E|nr:N-6 DNA methylase [Deinococcus aestuarii]